MHQSLFDEGALTNFQSLCWQRKEITNYWKY